jgi:hypothetical protein
MMTDYRFIKVSRAGDVMTIALNRPDKLNALTPAVFDDLCAAFDNAVGHGARAVVLTGEGGSSVRAPILLLMGRGMRACQRIWARCWMPITILLCANWPLWNSGGDRA